MANSGGGGGGGTAVEPVNVPASNNVITLPENYTDYNWVYVYTTGSDNPVNSYAVAHLKVFTTNTNNLIRLAGQSDINWNGSARTMTRAGSTTVNFTGAWLIGGGGSSSGGGLDTNAVRALIQTWAQTGNTTAIPSSKLPTATEGSVGAVERATTTEVQAGTDTERYVTPKHLSDEITRKAGTGDITLPITQDQVSGLDTSLAAKQDKITGNPLQDVRIGADGNVEVVDATDASGLTTVTASNTFPIADASSEITVGIAPLTISDLIGSITFSFERLVNAVWVGLSDVDVEITSLLSSSINAREILSNGSQGYYVWRDTDNIFIDYRNDDGTSATTTTFRISNISYTIELAALTENFAKINSTESVPVSKLGNVQSWARVGSTSTGAIPVGSLSIAVGVGFNAPRGYVVTSNGFGASWSPPDTSGIESWALTASIGNNRIIPVGRLSFGSSGQVLTSTSGGGVEWRNPTGGSGGGGGLTQSQVDARISAEVESWALDGNTEDIPLSKLDNVEDWAQVGNTEQIPLSKLGNAPGGGSTTGGITQAQATSLIATWARASSSTLIPINKLPTSLRQVPSSGSTNQVLTKTGSGSSSYAFRDIPTPARTYSENVIYNNTTGVASVTVSNINNYDTLSVVMRAEAGNFEVLISDRVLVSDIPVASAVGDALQNVGRSFDRSEQVIFYYYKNGTSSSSSGTVGMGFTDDYWEDSRIVKITAITY